MQRAIERMRGVAAQDARADQRVRIDVGVARGTGRGARCTCASAPGAKRRQRRRVGVDLVAEDPQVPGARCGDPRRASGAATEHRMACARDVGRGIGRSMANRRLRQYSGSPAGFYCDKQTRHHGPADGSPQYTNRLLARDQSVPAPARAQSGRLVSRGARRRFERARAERKPIRSQRRLCRLPLVPRAWRTRASRIEATAQVMNELFVNIKVDREERPDIDHIYQIAQQMLTQRSGGWPLTMFLTHDDQRPFFGGTYFPKEARYGLPAFKDLLLRVAEYYREHETELRAAERGADGGLRASSMPPPAAADTELTDAPLQPAAQQLARDLRSPHTAASAARRNSRIRKTLERLLRDWRASAAQRRAGPAGALHGDPDAAAHGRRRHQRPAGRRLLPLLRRCALDDPALREDAVRQRRAARGVRGGRASRPATPFYARVAARDRGLDACARCSRPKAASTRASTPTPKATKASSTSGTATRCARR